MRKNRKSELIVGGLAVGSLFTGCNLTPEQEARLLAASLGANSSITQDPYRAAAFRAGANLVNSNANSMHEKEVAEISRSEINIYGTPHQEVRVIRNTKERFPDTLTGDVAIIANSYDGDLNKNENVELSEFSGIKREFSPREEINFMFYSDRRPGQTVTLRIEDLDRKGDTYEFPFKLDSGVEIWSLAVHPCRPGDDFIMINEDLVNRLEARGRAYEELYGASPKEDGGAILKFRKGGSLDFSKEGFVELQDMLTEKGVWVGYRPSLPMGRYTATWHSGGRLITSPQTIEVKR